MSDKVHGGTPIGFHSLCKTCRMAHFVRGLNLQEAIYCRSFNQPQRITFPVEMCSLYDDKRVPSMYQMEQIAWNVTARNRGATGFAGNCATEIHIEPPDPNRNAPPQPPLGETHD